MSDDLIPMGNDLGGDSGPSFSPETSAPDVGADDHGLAGLDQALGGGGGQQFTPAPAQAPQQRPQPQQFDRRATYLQGQKKSARTWMSRQMERSAELQRLKEEREGYASQMKEVAELLKGVAGAFPQRPEEPVPDPMLDPKGFQEWWTKQNSSLLDEKMKPILSHFESLQRRQDAIDQREQQTHQQQEVVQRVEGALKSSHQQYAEQYPELEYGSEDRIGSGFELLSRVFTGRLGWEQGDALASSITLAVARHADAGGENPAMAVDQFFTGIIEEAAEALIEHFNALGYNLPPFYIQMGPGVEQPAFQPAPVPQQPNPAARENQRLQQVRQRAQTVANPRPRQPARGNGNQPTSQAWALAASYRQAGRQVDWDAVQRQAMAEAGGNKQLALKIMQQIPAA